MKKHWGRNLLITFAILAVASLIQRPSVKFLSIKPDVNGEIKGIHTLTNKSDGGPNLLQLTYDANGIPAGIKTMSYTAPDGRIIYIDPATVKIAYRKK